MERNYKIHDKEMLAVIHCLEAWRHFLKGSRSKFEVWTNHKNLEYFISNQKLNHRQARWALYLSRFDFVLKHISGSKMGKADGLSRRPDWEVGVEKNNEECHEPPNSPKAIFIFLFFSFNYVITSDQ